MCICCVWDSGAGLHVEPGLQYGAGGVLGGESRGLCLAAFGLAKRESVSSTIRALPLRHGPCELVLGLHKCFIIILPENLYVHILYLPFYQMKKLQECRNFDPCASNDNLTFTP